MARLPWTHVGRVRLIKATLGGQPTRDDAHTTFASASLLQHRLIVLAQPASDVFAHVKGGHSPKSPRARACPAPGPAHTATPENRSSPLSPGVPKQNAGACDHSRQSASRHRQALSDQDRPCPPRVPVNAVARPFRSNCADWVGSAGSTTPHRGSQPPIRSAGRAQ